MGAQAKNRVRPNIELQKGQPDVSVEQQVAMRDACKDKGEIGGKGKECQPSAPSRASRTVDGIQQAVGIDRRFGIQRRTDVFVHGMLPPDSPAPHLMRTTIREKLWRSAPGALSG